MNLTDKISLLDKSTRKPKTVEELRREILFGQMTKETNRVAAVMAKSYDFDDHGVRRKRKRDSSIGSREVINNQRYRRNFCRPTDDISPAPLRYLRMDESNASGGGRGKNKRFWTSEEDKALVSALLDLAIDPHWKCKNGFRNGYMVRLEEVVNKAIPGCGLKAMPHIDSRLKTLVTKFRAIVQMLGISGFKWDNEKSMISVEKSVYDEYCKVHPNCKNLYGNVFPHFNSLMEIYGKDYATGKPAGGFIQAIENMEKSDPEQDMIDSSDDDDYDDDNDEDEDDEDTLASGNATQTVESAPSLKKVNRENISESKGGKKECESATGSELSCLQAFMKDMNVHLATIASVMSRADEREQQLFERSEKVLDELLLLECITPEQALEVAQVLTAQPHKLVIFFKCPNDALKIIYVKSLLGGNDARV